MRRSSTCSAIRAAWSYPSSISPSQRSLQVHPHAGTSRARSTPRTAMPAPRGRSGSSSPPRVPARPTASPGSPRPTWIRCPWWSSPARSRGSMIGNDAFQEVDITGITRPITKHNYLVQDIKDLARIIKEAFYIASTGRPGPVLIDVPVDISNGEYKFHYPEDGASCGATSRCTRAIPGRSRRPASSSRSSKRPVIYAGGGVVISNASKELREFVKKTGIPVTTTLLGLGVYPGNGPARPGDAGHARHLLREPRGERVRPAHRRRRAVRRPGHRQDRRNSSPTRRSSISISTPRRSARTCRWTFPSWATAGTCSREMNRIVKAPKIDEWADEIEKLKKEHPLTYEMNERRRR